MLFKLMKIPSWNPGRCKVCRCAKLGESDFGGMLPCIGPEGISISFVGIIRIMRRDCVAAAMTEDFTGLIRILIALTLIIIKVGEHAQARAPPHQPQYVLSAQIEATVRFRDFYLLERRRSGATKDTVDKSRVVTTLIAIIDYKAPQTQNRACCCDMAIFCGLGPGECEISELGARAREYFIKRDVSELIRRKSQRPELGKPSRTSQETVGSNLSVTK